MRILPRGGRALLLAALVSCFPASVRACSQCMCGTPFPSDVLGGLVPMQWRYGFEDRYLSKANALDEEPGAEAEREHRVSGFVLWRAGDRLALMGRLPYNVKRIVETPAGGATSVVRASGVGDLETMALVGIARSRGARPASLSGMLGFTAPTGSNQRRDAAGDRLDAHLQPGAGAWSGTLGVSVAFPTTAGLWDANLMGRRNGTSAHGYRYGQAALWNAGYTTPERRGFSAILQINGRVAARDRLEDGTLGANTGGTALYVAPGVRWRSALGLGVEGAIQIPAAERLCGDQDEHATGRLALSVGR